MDIIELSDFNDFFGLFAALNLGYAGSSEFRAAVDEDIFNISDVYKKAEESIANMIAKASLIEGNFSVLARGQIEIYKISVSDKKKEFEDFKASREAYLKSYKAMFFITFLCCTFIMGTSGYLPIFNKENYCNMVFFIDLIMFLNLFIFAKGFKHENHINISPLGSTGIFLGLCAISCLLVHERFANIYIVRSHNMPALIFTCMLLAISPYLLHFIRAIFQRFEVRIKLRTIMAEIQAMEMQISKFITAISNEHTSIQRDNIESQNSV